MAAEAEKNKRLQARKIFGIFLMLFGMMVIFLPELQALKVQQDGAAVLQKFSEKRADPKDQTALWNEICRYNRQIFENEQEEFTDEETVTHPPDILRSLKSDLFGYIEIPVMNCQLPLYLGASADNMEHGAVVLGGTSVPIGGSNTNSVIAGHRGWKRNKFFKDIEKLSPGDAVYVTNLWETLAYRVESTEVIEPDDSEKVKIQAGKDMITLITCHPYRSGGRYRYVVYCVRDFTECLGTIQ